MKELKIQFKILGRSWTLRLLPKRRYKRKHGPGSVGSTDVERRRIDLRPSGFDRATITHELVHAFMGEMCLHSADLDQDSMEEIFAELFSKRGREMLKLSKRLFVEVEGLTT